MVTKHDEVAKRIADKKGVAYNRGQGPDVQTSSQAIEVETESTIADAGRQLAGFRKPVYIAGATEKATKRALKHYKDSTIGVMDPSGKVLKPSTRKRK